MRFAFCLLLVTLLGAQVSCSVGRLVSRGASKLGSVRANQDVPKKLPSDEEMAVGEVSFVRSGGQPFVLVRTRGKVELPEKAMLHGKGEEGQLSTMRLSGEKRGAYIVADILSGRPKLGDLVTLTYPKESKLSANELAPVPEASPEPTPAVEESTVPPPSPVRTAKEILGDLPPVPDRELTEAPDPSGNGLDAPSSQPIQPMPPPPSSAPAKLPGQDDEPFMQRVQ